LDHTNKSDSRIARLAVTKFQVSGLARVNAVKNSSSAGRKSERTIVIEPGGPGGSGTGYAWRMAQNVSERFSDGRLDVLGWDPRGVNASLPAVECFPYDAERDHWNLLSSLHYAVSDSPTRQLEIADAMNAAVMRACWERHGDLGRFVGTGLVARDLEQIRIALGEDELTGYLVSYGTGIGQTYAAMFPGSVGRLILDGTEYVRDHRLRGGFGWTALDNATDAWRDGFLGECINAGPDHCALARPRDGKPVTLSDLETRMDTLMKSLAARPVPGYLEARGPTLVTYSLLVDAFYGAMYNPRSWPTLAQTLYELEAGNSTLAASTLERSWQYDPALPCSPDPMPASDLELGTLVICADSYDAPGPDDLEWWLSLWGNMTSKSWIAGNSRFYNVLPCRHFLTYWPDPVGVYRGDLNQTLKHPVLLIAETYDPATPLRNGRRLLQEMGANARLIAHHGYGHSSRDTSSCTESLAKAYILNGTLPDEPETACYADEKPYLYGVKENNGAALTKTSEDPVKAWQQHLTELSFMNPRLLPGRR
jgi:pimeloyl-ACP methyl ester carboxylesterase